ncbi:MAG: NAD-dependent epimerase/dehydratase family protein [Acidimicrobiales bacterium]
MARILVTGGSGFIGSAVVDALVTAGHRVRVLDQAEPARPNAGAEYLKADLRDHDAVRAAVRGVDAVSHQAAKVGLEAGMADAVDYASTNDVGTAVLLAALDEAGFGSGGSGRLVLASSMVVYGEGRYRCVEHAVVRPPPRAAERLAAGDFDPTCPRCGGALVAEPVTEDAVTDPRNVYAATKLHQEHLCAVFGWQRGVAVTALRYHNVYGPGMPRDNPYSGVAAIFASSLRSGEAPRVFEDGRQRRDFVHASDVARANLLALTCEPPVEGPVNVATGFPRSVGGLAAALADAFGPGAPQPVITGGYRLGDVRHVFASPTRAEELMGFRAEVDLHEGMRELAASL